MSRLTPRVGVTTRTPASRRRKEALVFLAFALPNLALIAVFTYRPLFLNIYYSTLDWTLGSPTATPIGLANYQEFFSSPDARQVLWITAVFTVCTVVGTMALGLLVALGLNKRVRGAGFARATVFSPFVLSGVGVGLAWLYIFDPTVGVQRLYWSKNFQPGVPFSNGSAYNNPKVDALLEASAIEVDSKKRVEQWRQIQEILVDDLPALDIVSQPELTIYNKRIADHTLGGEGISGSLAYAYLATA